MARGEPRGSGRDAEQGETVWPGCCRAGQAGSLGTGDCGIGESEGRGSGRTVGALKAGGKNTASRGRVPRHGRAAGVGQRMQAGLPARQDGDDARPARVSGVDVYLPVQVGDDQAAEVEPEAVALAEGVEFGETLEDIAVLLGRGSAAVSATATKTRSSPRRSHSRLIVPSCVNL